jgi:hypothetical protein
MTVLTNAKIDAILAVLKLFTIVDRVQAKMAKSVAVKPEIFAHNKIKTIPSLFLFRVLGVFIVGQGTMYPNPLVNVCLKWMVPKFFSNELVAVLLKVFVKLKVFGRVVLPVKLPVIAELPFVLTDCVHESRAVAITINTNPINTNTVGQPV